ncbi:UDP-glycosyltransferase [Gramella sp. AN32]|uniref:UDP-glycosyltransferase n=1 Tax=Christiangramia antarctica TaxID=2058158 RepID=A0ABW5X5M1_9FLAO|nr:UDP-glycosyltransferase [Gramella sp. AN32]MCM4154695.1 UDP-glycosyltransferase [Gramella sp. AN32]
MSQRILIVAESIDVEDSSGTKGRVALIKNLSLLGYEVTVFHYTRKEIKLEGIKTISIKEIRSGFLFLLSRLERQIRYRFRLRLNKYIENYFGFSFTLLNDSNSIAKALGKVSVSEYDIIVTLSKGGSFRPHHSVLKLPQWHKKWLAYIHDPYPMHHYPKPYTWRESGSKKKEEFISEISKNARWSGFPSLLLKEWMGQFHPNFLKTGVIIPHQNFYSDTPDIAIPEFFNPNEFNLLHAGTLLGARNPEWLLEAFKNFISENPDAKACSKLLFIGGENPHVSEKSANDNIYVSKGYMKFETVYSLQNKTAVNIILEAKSNISPFLPGKFPHCVEANKPILLLGPQKSEAKRLLGSDYPYWSEIDDINKIKEHIESLYFQWKNDSFKEISNRDSLLGYLGPEYLKGVIESLNISQ